MEFDTFNSLLLIIFTILKQFSTVINGSLLGFRYNAASARNGTLIPEEEREVSVTLWSKHDGLKCYPPQYHTEGKNTNKEVPSVKWENCVDHAPFLEIVGLVWIHAKTFAFLPY